MIARVWCTWESSNNFLQTGCFTDTKLDWLTQLLCSNYWGQGGEEELVDCWGDLEIGRWFSHWASQLQAAWTSSLSDFCKKNVKVFSWAILVTYAKIWLYNSRAFVFELYWEMGMSSSNSDASWGKGMVFWIRENYVSGRNRECL